MSKSLAIGALATALALAIGLAGFAQDKQAEKKPPQGKVKVAAVHRLDTITGMEVKNTQGEDLGQIEDLVMELNSGDIRYAALSFGGFAGLGDKLFAVPWNKLTFKFGEDESYFILDIPEEKLKRAPGFDQNKWPDTADEKWAQEIDTYYGSRREGTREPAPVREPDKAKPGRLTYDAVYRGATIVGMEVKNDSDKDLGTINELVVDLEKGRIRYAALSFGGFAGLGDKLFAIPWKALRFRHEGTDKHFVLNVTQEQLKDAPGFDENAWPNTGDPRWSREIDEFYRVPAEREAKRPQEREPKRPE